MVLVPGRFSRMIISAIVLDFFAIKRRCQRRCIIAYLVRERDPESYQTQQARFTTPPTSKT